MPADNAHHLRAAAQRRTEQTRHRAVAALRRLDAAGAPVTLDGLAREAGVSRSWLYTQHDLRLDIERRRRRHRPASAQATVPPERQRASDASAAAAAPQPPPSAFAASSTTTNNCATPSPAPSANAEPPTSSATPPSTTRRTANPRNSSARADREPSRPSLPTPSTTEPAAHRHDQLRRVKITEGRLRSPVSLATRMRSSARARRRCRSSRSASWRRSGGVGGERGQPVAVAVGEPQLCAGMWAVPCARSPASRPASRTGEQPGHLGHPGAVTRLAVGVVGDSTPSRGSWRASRPSARGGRTRPSRTAAARQPVQERVGAAGGVGADQHLAARPSPAGVGQLRQRVPDDRDVVGGGVRAGVARPQQHRHRLPVPARSAVIDERPQRVMAEPALERRRRTLFLQLAQVRAKVCKVAPAAPGLVRAGWRGGAGVGRGRRCRRRSGPDRCCSCRARPRRVSGRGR